MSGSLEAWRGSQHPALHPRAAAGYQMPVQSSAALWASELLLLPLWWPCQCPRCPARLGDLRCAVAIPAAGCGCPGDVPAAELPFTCQARLSEESGVMAQLFIPPHPAAADVVSSFNCLSAGQPLKGDATAQSHKASLKAL